MKSIHQEIELRLEQTQSQGLHRSLSPPQGVDFCSNDYLGLSTDPHFRTALLNKLNTKKNFHLSAPSSRLLRGHTLWHQDIEKQLSSFKGTESSLLFPTGYQANLGLLTTLLRPQDRVLSDIQNHASIIDGLRLSGCQKIIFSHLDTKNIEQILSTPYKEGRTFLITESLFSMDGDIAPLDHYSQMLEEYGAHLIVDDAHATGIFGKSRGSGLCEHFGIEKQALAIVSTLGKAFGLFGSFVSGSQILVDLLINHCRPFIFTTSVPPFLLAGIEVALDILNRNSGRRDKLLLLANRLRCQLREEGLETLQSVGPIIPVIIGENNQAIEVANHLQKEGFDVRAIRPPTVSPKTARLRISVHADHSEKTIDRLATALLVLKDKMILQVQQ
jgi:8-amino-7-oxononanoate synthase